MEVLSDHSKRVIGIEVERLIGSSIHCISVNGDLVEVKVLKTINEIVSYEMVMTSKSLVVDKRFNDHRERVDLVEYEAWFNLYKALIALGKVQQYVQYLAH